MQILESGAGELIQRPDIDAFREWNRTHKPKVLRDKLMTEGEAISRFVHDGAYIGTELLGSVRGPLSLVRELIRQGYNDLRLLGNGTLTQELLLASGAIKSLDISYVGLEVHGTSKVLRRQVESGCTKTVDWSNGAISWRLKATAMGSPFIPVRVLLGSDTLKRSAAKVAECPFTGQKVTLLPALILDVGMIHVHRADRYGNAQIDGITGFAAELARASKRLIISAEEIVSIDEMRRQPERTIIPYYLVDAVVYAPFGSHPGEMAYCYTQDERRIKEWVEASKTESGTRAYLDKYVHGVATHADYLALPEHTRLEELAAQMAAQSGEETEIGCNVW